MSDMSNQRHAPAASAESLSRLSTKYQLAAQFLSRTGSYSTPEMRERALISIGAWVAFIGNVDLELAWRDLEERTAEQLPPLIAEEETGSLDLMLEDAQDNLASEPEQALRHLANLDAKLSSKLSEVHSRFSGAGHMELYNELVSGVVTPIQHQLKTAYLMDKGREASQTVEHINRASGQAGESRLAKEYSDYGQREGRTAMWFRTATVTLVVAGIGLAIVLPQSEPQSIPQAIYRLAILGAVFGLAGYLGRQAHQHRSISVWASSISIQLLTFDAFLDPIGEVEVRNQLRAEFAGRVFGPSPKLKGEPGVTMGPELADRLLAAVSKPTK
jgi:hypothetical protein